MRLESTGGRLALACLVCAALRLPALRWDVISDDEAIYDAMARTVAAGGVMYRDTVDHKPPGLVYSYAAIYRALDGASYQTGITAVHLFGLLAAVATCLGLYAVARRLLEERLWALPSLLYAVVSAAKQPVDGLAVNGELLMNLPTVLAVAAALEGGRRNGARRMGWDLLAGVLVGVAALYKYQALVVLIALPALLWPVRARTGDGDGDGNGNGNGNGNGLARLARMAAWAIGLALPPVAALFFFHQRGALDDAVAWGVLFNRSYLAEGPGITWALGRLGLQLVGVVLPGAVLYVGGVAALAGLVRGGAGDDVREGRRMLAVWSALALATVALGGRFFGHYFLQAELPLALLAAGPAARLSSARRAIALALPALAFFALAVAPSQSRRLFNARDPDYRAIGRSVAARTAPSDTIWVWGNVPQIYFAAERRAGVRFTFCNYLTGLSPGTPSEYRREVDPRAAAVASAWGLALEDLDRRRPTLIVDTSPGDLKSYGKFPPSTFPELAAYLAAHYRPDGAVDGVTFWRRRD
ncbi:MAG: hypothetical protein EXR72_18910 [Myxococcales bacterium]|nr:hypothetical protein [Myxococcales bacterium]